jgi:hypothetical protein
VPKIQPTTALLTGLKAYLEKYIRQHYPRLPIVNSWLDERGAFADCQLGKQLMIRFRLPKDAPLGARPLFSQVTKGEVVVWSYLTDYRPTVKWGQTVRVHLHDFRGEVYWLIHVQSGEPYDIVDRVTYLNNLELSPESSTIAKALVARLWGMTTALTRLEKRWLAKKQDEFLAGK